MPERGRTRGGPAQLSSAQHPCSQPSCWCNGEEPPAATPRGAWTPPEPPVARWAARCRPCTVLAEPGFAPTAPGPRPSRARSRAASPSSHGPKARHPFGCLPCPWDVGWRWHWTRCRMPVPGPGQRAQGGCLLPQGQLSNLCPHPPLLINAGDEALALLWQGLRLPVGKVTPSEQLLMPCEGRARPGNAFIWDINYTRFICLRAIPLQRGGAGVSAALCKAPSFPRGL